MAATADRPPKVWERFNRSSSWKYDENDKHVTIPSDLEELRPGDTIGIAGLFDEVVTVVKISPSGQITTTSKREVYDGRAGAHVVKERRYFTNRGEEKGYSDRGSHWHRDTPQLVGTLVVAARKRARRYDAALHALEKFTKNLREARAEGGYGRRQHAAEPITREEYAEIARLAKACLDDGYGDERPTPICMECFAQYTRGQEHAKTCSKRPPDPVPETPPEVVLDGVCPGCGHKGDELCTPECEVQSNPAPFTADPAPRLALACRVVDCPGCGRSGEIPCPQDCPAQTLPPLPPEQFHEAVRRLQGDG